MASSLSKRWLRIGMPRTTNSKPKIQSETRYGLKTQLLAIQLPGFGTFGFVSNEKPIDSDLLAWFWITSPQRTKKCVSVEKLLHQLSVNKITDHTRGIPFCENFNVGPPTFQWCFAIVVNLWRISRSWSEKEWKLQMVLDTNILLLDWIVNVQRVHLEPLRTSMSVFRRP